MKVKLLFLAILYFPGTVLHELSHFFMAKLLFVRTGRISLYPKFDEHGLQLGSVEIGKTDFIRHFLIGIAPLLVGICVLALIVFLLYSVSFPWWMYLVLGYGILTVSNTMSLSRSDLRGAWKVALILVLAMLFIIGIQWM